jgi:hypothetical protein
MIAFINLTMGLRADTITVKTVVMFKTFPLL